LPDLALLAKVREIDHGQLRRAFEQTFDFRGTHNLPTTVPDPPSSWAEIYKRMAGEDELEWKDLPSLIATVRAFLEPILSDKTPGTSQWCPGSWVWESE
jgi:hypothetical protein